jgi:hypothetical protein
MGHRQRTPRCHLSFHPAGERTRCVLRLVLRKPSIGKSPGAVLPGWRHSGDRTSLQEDSLASGNFTGNFAILGPRDTIWYQETAALQPLLEQFPTQIIRGNILGIKEFLNGIRELGKRPFLAHLSV